MKTDQEIQQNVIEQLRWDPLLTASEIGVAVKNGIVTLSGQVDSLFKKIEAEKETKKVAGVKAIAEDIQVGVSLNLKKTDAEIAEAAVNALTWHTSIPEEQIKIKVEDATVTLTGEVEWDFQREAAKNAVIGLLGVRSVINVITLKQRLSPADLKKKIQSAFHRSATTDANKIQVELDGSKAVLSGKVRSLIEKEDAESAIWAAPGITKVENRLEVEEEREFSY